MSNEEILIKFRKWISEAYDYETALREHDLTQDDIDNFREILISSDHVPRAFMDKALLLFLATCNKNLDKSVNFMEVYCKTNKDAPEFFGNRDVESKEIQLALDNEIFLPLPPTPQNCNLLMHRLTNYDPKKFVFDNTVKTFIISVGKNFGGSNESVKMI